MREGVAARVSLRLCPIGSIDLQSVTELVLAMARLVTHQACTATALAGALA